MKRLSLLLCFVCLFSLIFASCSHTAPSDKEEPPVTSSGGQSEAYSDSHSEETESEPEAEHEHVPQISCVAQADAPVWENKTIVLGAEEQLEKWLACVDDFESITNIIITSAASNEKELTADEAVRFLDGGLRSLAPAVMSEDTNPKTGMDIYIYAYVGEEELWRLSVGGFGILVEFPGDVVYYRFAIDETAEKEVFRFAD